MAKLVIDAQSEGSRRFDLGYSDIATVSLNGQPIVRLDGSYSFDRPRRQGLIGFDQANLFLPLRQGRNVLEIVVEDGFGGWGLLGRFPDDEGLTLTP